MYLLTYLFTYVEWWVRLDEGLLLDKANLVRESEDTKRTFVLLFGNAK